MKNTPTLLTTIALLIASLAYVFGEPQPSLGGFGSYLGGIATAIAIGWIILNSNKQRKALELQQEELSLQREATEEIAEANNISSAISLFSPAMDCLTKDCQAIWKHYSNCELESENNDTSIEEVDINLATANVAENIQFGKWVKQKVIEEDILIISMASTIVQRYEYLAKHLKESGKDSELYKVLLDASQAKKAHRRLKSILDIKD